MKNLKKTLSIFLAIALILSSAISFDSSSVRAATPKLSKTVISLFSGKSTTLKVSGTDKAVKWSSSDKNIASVSKKGKVTGKNAGKAIITATIGKQTLQCKVTVKAILSMTKVTLAENDFINLSLKGASIKSISSDKPSTVFAFKDKTIQGIKKGKATITVVDTAGREYFCTIKVEQPFLNEKSITLEEGQYYPLRLNGNTQKISWISKNEKVALVTSRGFVIARSKGKTSIYARVGTRYFKCEVKVLAKKKAKSNSNSYAHTNSDSRADSYAHTGTNGNSDSDSNSDSNSNSGADSNSDSLVSVLSGSRTNRSTASTNRHGCPNRQ